jgi:hypothetical protein
MALRCDAREARHLGSASHEAHHVAGAGFGHGVVQAGERTDVKGRHDYESIQAGSSYTIRIAAAVEADPDLLRMRSESLTGGDHFASAAVTF